MFATSNEALASAVREDIISSNLVNLSNGYLRDGKVERAEKLAKLATLRNARMLDDFDDALTLELRGL